MALTHEDQIRSVLLVQHIQGYDKSVKCIFVGYSIESKGFRLYDPVTRQRIIINRDVVFAENETMQPANVTLVTI